uniref:Uncharacterized protein n=1 Tax=Calla Lily Valley virus TaxID=3139873 RepID=A0AAN0N8N0_9VIRU
MNYEVSHRIRDGTWNVFRRGLDPWCIHQRPRFRTICLDMASLDIESLIQGVLSRSVRWGEPVVMAIGTHGNATSIFAHGRAYPRAGIESGIETLAHRFNLTVQVLWQCCQGTVSSHVELVEAREENAPSSEWLEINPGLRGRERIGEWLSRGLGRFRHDLRHFGENVWSGSDSKMRVYHWMFAPVGFMLRRHNGERDLEMDAANFLYFVLGVNIFLRPKVKVLRKLFKYVQRRWNCGHGALKISY